MLNAIYLQAIIDAGDDSISRAIANNPDTLETIWDDDNLIKMLLPFMTKETLSISYAKSRKVRKYIHVDLKKHHSNSQFMSQLREVAEGKRDKQISSILESEKFAAAMKAPTGGK